MTSDDNNRKALLDSLRMSIDDIDSNLLNLLNKRMELSYQIGKLKCSFQDKNDSCQMPIYDGKREKAVLTRLKNINTGRLLPEHITDIWVKIFAASRELQKHIVNGVQS